MTAFAGRGRRLSVALALALSAGGLLAVSAADAVRVKARPLAGQRVTDSGIVTASVPTTSPIKHVIVIIGENHTFDNVFATYKSHSGAYVKNLLS